MKKQIAQTKSLEFENWKFGYCCLSIIYRYENFNKNIELKKPYELLIPRMRSIRDPAFKASIHWLEKAQRIVNDLKTATEQMQQLLQEGFEQSIHIPSIRLNLDIGQYQNFVATPDEIENRKKDLTSEVEVLQGAELKTIKLTSPFITKKINDLTLQQIEELAEKELGRLKSRINKKRGPLIEFEPLKFEVLKILNWISNQENKNELYDLLFDFLYKNKVEEIFCSTIFDERYVHKEILSTKSKSDYYQWIIELKRDLESSLTKDSHNRTNALYNHGSPFNSTLEINHLIKQNDLHFVPPEFHFNGGYDTDLNESPKYTVWDKWFFTKYRSGLKQVYDQINISPV